MKAPPYRTDAIRPPVGGPFRRTGPEARIFSLRPPRSRIVSPELYATLFLALLLHAVVLLSMTVLSPRMQEHGYRFFDDVKLIDTTRVSMVKIVKPAPPPPLPRSRPVAPPPPVARLPVPQPVRAPAPAPGGAPAPKAPVYTQPVAHPQSALPVVASQRSNGPAIAVGRGGGNPNGVPNGTGNGRGNGSGTGTGNGRGGTGTGGTGSGGSSGPTAPTPYLAWGTASTLSDGTIGPLIQSWGPYHANESYKITGEATVHLTLVVSAQGRAVSFHVTRVELGQPDNGVAPDKRMAEAQHYVETVIGPSVWKPAQKDGQPTDYKTDDYVVGITMKSDSGNPAPPPPNPEPTRNPLGL